MAKTNIAATGAVCCRPLRTNGPICPPDPGQNGGDGRDGDQRHERRHAPAHDRGEQEPDGRESKEGQHASTPPRRYDTRLRGRVLRVALPGVTARRVRGNHS